MARYRKKPVVIEAVQLTWATWDEMCGFAGVSPHPGAPFGVYVRDDGTVTKDFEDGTKIGLMIPTLEGDMLAVEDDFVIRGVKGELYPCKPDIFAETYEPAENPHLEPA
jgi:hypothetical protein